MDDSRQPGAERASRARPTRWSTRERGLLILAARPASRRCLERYKLERHGRSRTLQGRGARAASASGIRSTTALSPVYLGEYVTLDSGTGIVHSAPAYGVEDFMSCRRYGMKDDEILNPVHGRRPLRAVAAAVRRPDDLGSESEDRRRRCAKRGALFARREVHAQLHALLAPQDADHLSRHHAVVRRHGRRARRTAAPTAARDRAAQASRRPQFFPAWGKARLHGMIANRPDWTLSRQRQWGVPMPFFVAQGDRRAASAHAGAARAGRASGSSRAASRPGRRSTARAARRRRRRSTRRTATRSTSGSTPAPRTRRCCAARTRRAVALPGRPLPRRLGPASRLVPFVAADVVHAERPCRRTRRC